MTLAPTSRELFPGTRESFQGFLVPVFEYQMLRHGLWQAGPSFRGHFDVNEGGFRQFNLQSYEPGFFVERSVPLDSAVVVPRMQYTFTHDEFDFQTFGNRHAVTPSLVAYWDGGDSTFAYGTVDHTDFAGDGVLPSVTSRDGWTYSLGVRHTFAIDRPHLRSIHAGIDFQIADTTGSDFTYNGVNLYGGVTVPIVDGLDLLLDAGWGYRDYHRFEFTPSRDENVWRAGAELRKQTCGNFSVSLVFNYDRFDSRNALFEADRYLAGVQSVFEF